MTTKPNSLTLAKWLQTAETALRHADIATARLDCLVLLEDLLHTDRTQLLAHSDQLLSVEHLKTLNAQLTRRQNHEPLAYIRGRTEFYGRQFAISPDTLEPRPETETMVELAKKLHQDKPETDWKVADVGAGSGAIGITLALEIPGSKVDMFEISLPAIKIAEQNIKSLQAPNCEVYHSDLLAVAKGSYDLVVANLPYVPDAHTINKAAMQEPTLAIFGGPDGLELYRQLFKQLEKTSPKWVLTESLPFQHKELSKIAHKAGYHLEKTDDFIQSFKSSLSNF